MNRSQNVASVDKSLTVLNIGKGRPERKRGKEKKEKRASAREELRRFRMESRIITKIRNRLIIFRHVGSPSGRVNEKLDWYILEWNSSNFQRVYPSQFEVKNGVGKRGEKEKKVMKTVRVSRSMNKQTDNRQLFLAFFGQFWSRSCVALLK